MKILVLGGGNSSEREVSLRSAAAVQQALNELGHTVAFIDTRDNLGTITEAARGYDAVLPILHGADGEDGTVQKLLDAAGVPYLGSDAAASELCFDKVRLLDVLKTNGVRVPRGQVVDAQSFANSDLAKAPFVLKPIADGSSVGMMIARTLPFDAGRADELLAKYGKMLLEELVEGVETTVPVLGNAALPVIEIVPPEGKEFDYENKYNGATTELCPPQHVDAATQVKAQRLAERVHQLSGARHLSRVDIIVTPAGELVVLEINTMPGMTAQSLFPKAAAVAGYTWPKLVEKLVNLATSG